MRYKGRLIDWNDERGFGFVTPEGSNSRLFVHISDFPDSAYRPRRGDWITYELGTDAKKRPCAAKVRRVTDPADSAARGSGEQPTRSDWTVRPGAGSRLSLEPLPEESPAPPPPGGSLLSPGVLFALAFLALLGSAAFLGWIALPVFAFYLFASALSVLLYAIDKRAARRDEWRTPEKTLHLISLAGGWPGALISQRLFRHKSSKRSFQVVFWLTVLLNLGALVLVHTVDPRTLLTKASKAVDQTGSTLDVGEKGVYKCLDKRGEVLYSDRPCPN